MMLNNNNTKSIQRPILNPNLLMGNSHFLQVPSSGASSGGDGGGKRQRIDLCGGTPPQKFQRPREKSPESGDSSSEAAVGPNRPRYGSVSVIGRRRTMEDAIVILPSLGVEGFSFSAVYDGHGGAKVANLCRDKLHQILVEEIKGLEGDKIDWEKVMSDCFEKMDEKVVGCGTGDDEDEEVGSTATVAVVGEKVVVVANCGNSRVVLCRGGDAVVLSRDYKLDQPDEMERVESSGGRIINRNNSRLCGVLTTSRSIGDGYLKPYETSDPEVTVTKRTESDKFLIIASDGLWEVVSNDLACDIVTKCFNGNIVRSDMEKSSNASEAAAKLAELAIAKGSKDNISVIIVELNKPS